MAGRKHSGNGHERLHITETPDVSHIKNPDVTHEASDVSVSGVLMFVLGLTALGVVVFVLMWGMFRIFYAQETEKEPPAGPMAMKPEERLPPPPRLQAAKGFGVTLKNGAWVTLENKEPEAEYRVLREQWQRDLQCSEAPESAPAENGGENGTAAGLPNREPHDAGGTSPMETGGQDARAPSRSGAPGPPKLGCVPIDQAMLKVVGLPSRVKQTSDGGPGTSAADSGIDRPTAASSGRMTERGKQ